MLYLDHGRKREPGQGEERKACFLWDCLRDWTAANVETSYLASELTFEKSHAETQLIYYLHSLLCG